MKNIVIAILVILILGGGYYFMKNQDKIKIDETGVTVKGDVEVKNGEEVSEVDINKNGIDVKAGNGTTVKINKDGIDVKTSGEEKTQEQNVEVKKDNTDNTENQNEEPKKDSTEQKEDAEVKIDSNVGLNVNTGGVKVNLGL
ncbi:hypothetical protein CSB11_02260 [Candidatus Campbellbacteria bacterium]|nr:MAG: hypothetical protein CSB11_02260 [Candidatus Campbellbacteria bacterium]